MVHRVERIWLKPNYGLISLCSVSKRLYNRANFLIRQQLDYNRKLLSSYQLMDILRYSPSFRMVSSHTGQQIIKVVVDNWKSYFKANKEYKKDPSKFFAKPNPPKYKKYQFALNYTKYQVKLKDSNLHFPKQMGLYVKTRLNKDTQIHMTRILPRGYGYMLEIVYDRKVKEKGQLNSQRIGSIDLGVNNLITCTNNIGEKPIIIKGGILKSKNQYYNKEKARLQSIYDLQGIKFGSKLAKLQMKRYKQMEDLLHNASRVIINWCVSNKIDTIVIGYNELWKQRVNMGKRNNQNFVTIPFARIIQKLCYKAEDNGIFAKMTKESYTSKCSFIDNETIGKKKSYAGRRIMRGLYRSHQGILLNADCNGSGNIGRQVFPMRFCYGIVDVVSHPIRLELVATQVR
ncbi:MAG: RNA-guided endonuclease InsQ/TnpB family protein [Candidatus Kariarchaeaceae archaeon]